MAEPQTILPYKTMGWYEFIDHTADVAVRAYGQTLEEAFATAASAMFDIITGGAEIEPKKRTQFAVESIDREGLLVQFLSELIVLHEGDGRVFSDFHITFGGGHSLSAEMGSEPFDPERHAQGTQVKGVSYYMMEIVDGTPDEPAHVQVLFDI